ncbi:CHASE domain-containing protein [Undibacterium sp. Jales W-56]|uniref:CHASE domain-containing protein n=1 Tax=Undibacterium sp. Jales W-56 TaxID=2897325 RepID=UPI0021D07F1F|nr:CHASE domain-containing protein [Undibacterium sp. Jales W-56]MCU6432324.1 CHASE domain-containing protein [Undibacterium sp. Jales W-56]
MVTRLSRGLSVVVILCVSLGATYLLWHHEKNNAALDTRTSLDFTARDIASRIEQRLAASEQVLRGAQAVFGMSDTLKRKDFANYVNSLQLGADYAGMEGLGIALSIESGKLEQHVVAMRQQGIPDYQLYPLAATTRSTQAWIAPFVQIEPSLERNRSLLGFDALSDPAHKAAMERARDAGTLAITGLLNLAQDAKASSQKGFYVYLPVYKEGRVPDHPEARRSNLLGWVFAPFRMDDLMASLYGETPRATAIRIYDGVETSAGNLMYESLNMAAAKPELPAALKVFSRRDNAIEVTEYLANGGRSWSVVITALPGFEERLGKDKSGLIAITGIALSILFGLLTWQLVSGRERALNLAREMTRELRESEARFRYLAQYDELSGLPNRAMFRDRLKHAITAARRDKHVLALMYLDLDKFKPINDQLGHHVGDLLLRAVAEKMLHCVRESDTVARMGGDEFVILLPLIEHEQDALLVAEKIRQTLCEPCEVAGGHVLSISCSIGVALYPQHAQDDIELSRNADIAMYRAKELGRDRVQVFTPS